MIKPALAIILASAFALAPGPTRQAVTQTPPPPGWQLFTHAVGGFSVLLPGVPVANPPTSSKSGTSQTFTLAQAGRVFVIAFNDWNFDVTSPQIELNAARDSFLKGLGASLVSEHRFSSSQPIGPVAASEFVGQSAVRECKARTFFLLRRGYMVGVLSDRGLSSTIDTDRFMNSFQILPPR